MLSPEFVSLQIPTLLNLAEALPRIGLLKCDPTSSYCYLKISDDFIHTLFPILASHEENIQKPNYFSNQAYTGAHISVVYPNEDTAENIKTDIMQGLLECVHNFEIVNLIKAKLVAKTMFALVIKAKGLEDIRKKHGLPLELNYNGLIVPFHITVGIRIDSEEIR